MYCEVRFDKECIYHADGGPCLYCGKTLTESLSTKHTTWFGKEEAEIQNRIAKAAAKSIVGSDPELERIKKGIKNCDLNMEIDGRTMAEWGWTTFEDRPSQKWNEVNETIAPEKFCECGCEMFRIENNWVCPNCTPGNGVPYPQNPLDPSKVFYD